MNRFARNLWLARIRKTQANRRRLYAMRALLPTFPEQP